MKRKEMMVDCPPGFEDRLNEILDHIEGRVNAIKPNLEAGSLSSFSDIDDAYSMVDELATDLY